MAISPSPFYTRVFALVTALVLGGAVLLIMQPFIGPVLWASLLAFMLFPLNVRLRKALGGRQGAAALILTVASLLMLVVPAGVLGVAFGGQASDLIARAQTSAAGLQIQKPSDVLRIPVVEHAIRWAESAFPVTRDQIAEKLTAAGQQAIQSILSMGGSLFASVLGTAVAVLLALFLLFFFLRDGESMIGRAAAIVPLDDRRKARLLDGVAAVTRAVVLGSLATALVQGTLVGIAFAIAGLPSALVFGVLATGASLIPMVGTAIVWVPAAIYLALTGHTGAAVFIAVWGVVVVSSADNFVRPLFLSSRANITTLPAFIGLVGGISAFGAAGIFLGPVIVALVLALFEFAEESLAEQRSVAVSDVPNDAGTVG